MDNVSRSGPSQIKQEHFCSSNSLKEHERRGVLSVLLPNDRKRSVLIDQIAMVSRSLKLQKETFFAAVNILDAALERWEILPGSLRSSAVSRH